MSIVTIDPAAEHLRDRCFATTRFRCTKIRHTGDVWGYPGSVEIEPSVLLPVGGESHHLRTTQIFDHCIRRRNEFLRKWVTVFPLIRLETLPIAALNGFSMQRHLTGLRPRQSLTRRPHSRRVNAVTFYSSTSAPTCTLQEGPVMKKSTLLAAAAILALTDGSQRPGFLVVVVRSHRPDLSGLLYRRGGCRELAVEQQQLPNGYRLGRGR